MKAKWIITAGLVALCGMAQAAFVTIGNAGNLDDTTGYGAVAYEYNISSTEVTIAEFQASGASIGTANENYWSAVGTAAPASYVSLYEAMRYCNYLNGDVNSGYYSSSDGGVTYTANALSHDAYAAANGLTYFVPTEDEWYKAAYYDASGAGGYSLYANGTSTAPVAGTDANYGGSTAWVVGTGTEEQNGTDDMMGNVWEWMENSAGVIRGGGYGLSETYLRSSSRFDAYNPSYENYDVGFRPVEVVPEPATALSLVLGGLVVTGYRRFFGRV